MEKRFLLPAVSILGGGGGIALRRWQLDTAFEPTTGLPVGGTPAALAITLLSCAVVVLLILLSFSGGKADKAQALPYEKAFHCRSFLYLLSVSAAAVLTVTAALFFYMDSVRMPRNYLQLLFALLAFGAAACLTLIGKGNYQGRGMGCGSLLLLIPAYANCLWLMVAYQGWARDPFVSDYVFELFAIMTSMLAHYFIASYSFSKPRAPIVCVTAMLAVFFCLISLAGTNLLAEQCLFAAQILYLVPTVFVLCRNGAASGNAPDFANPDSDDHPLKEETP